MRVGPYGSTPILPDTCAVLPTPPFGRASRTKSTELYPLERTNRTPFAEALPGGLSLLRSSECRLVLTTIPGFINYVSFMTLMSVSSVYITPMVACKVHPAAPWGLSPVETYASSITSVKPYRGLSTKPPSSSADPDHWTPQVVVPSLSLSTPMCKYVAVVPRYVAYQHPWRTAVPSHVVYQH